MSEAVFLRYEQDKLYRCDESEAEFVRLPISEYNGYMKLLRMNSERKKRVSLENEEFKIVNAKKVGKNKFKDSDYFAWSDYEVWQVTYITPFDTSAPFYDILKQLREDFIRLVGYYDRDSLQLGSKLTVGGVNSLVCRGITKPNECEQEQILNFLIEHENKVAFGMDNFNYNEKIGRYEVTVFQNYLI